MVDCWIQKARSNTLEKRLSIDQEKGDFTDVVFRVGLVGNQRIFKAHRLVLASENYEFEKLIRASEASMIDVPDVHPKGFKNLIRYCYGENFHNKDLESIRETYRAAKKFKVKELQLNAENNLIHLIKVESLIKILSLCIELNMSRAKQRCLEAISSRLEMVLKAEELISAPQEVLEQILGLCPNRGLDFKVSAIGTIQAWAEWHECSDIVIPHLISMIRCENIPSDVIMSLKEKGVQLTEPQFQEGHYSKEVLSLEKNLPRESLDVVGNTVVSSLEKNLPRESLDVVGNTVVSSLEDEDSETSEVEPEILLTEEEIFKNEAEAPGLKDEKEIDLDGKATPEDENTSDSDDHFQFEEKAKKNIIRHASSLIKSCVADSARDTAKGIINVVTVLTKHSVENVQEAVNEMLHSINY